MSVVGTTRDPPQTRWLRRSQEKDRRTMSATALGSRRAGRDESQPQVTTYTRHTTHDRDEAERVIADLYLPNRLDLSADSTPLGMEVTGLRLGALTAGRLTYGRPVHLRTADAENFHVKLPPAGPGDVEKRLRRAGDHVARRGPGLLPRSVGRHLMVDGL
jgi:hypothetical protein